MAKINKDQENIIKCIEQQLFDAEKSKEIEIIRVQSFFNGYIKATQDLKERTNKIFNVDEMSNTEADVESKKE